MRDIKLSPRYLLAFLGVILVCGAIAFAWQRQAKMTAIVEADARRQVELAALEEARAAIPQKRCPIMNRKIYPDLSVEFRGRKVYFCCDSCPEQFLSDPVSFLAKLEPAEGATGDQSTQ